MPHENVEFIELVNRLHLCVLRMPQAWSLTSPNISFGGEFVVQVFGVDVLEPHFICLYKPNFLYIRKLNYFFQNVG